MSVKTTTWHVGTCEKMTVGRLKNFLNQFDDESAIHALIDVDSEVSMGIVGLELRTIPSNGTMPALPVLEIKRMRKGDK